MTVHSPSGSKDAAAGAEAACVGRAAKDWAELAADPAPEGAATGAAVERGGDPDGGRVAAGVFSVRTAGG